MQSESISIKTDSFDGPLGLLLALIKKEEMPLHALNIKVITKQYLDYLSKMHELNFDVAGDYLYLAATLLLLKSKSCIEEGDLQTLNIDDLEHPELRIQSQEDLILRLEELQKFQLLGQKLWTLPRLNQDIFIKPRVNRKAVINSILLPMDLASLTHAMMEFLEKDSRKFQIVKRDRLSIKEKLLYLKEVLVKDEQKTFQDILQDKSIDDIVITFISLLELARLHKIEVFQNEHGSEIYLRVRESLDSFNVDQADGFEPEENDIKVPEEVKLDVPQLPVEPIYH